MLFYRQVEFLDVVYQNLVLDLLVLGAQGQLKRAPDLLPTGVPYEKAGDGLPLLLWYFYSIFELRFEFMHDLAKANAPMVWDSYRKLVYTRLIFKDIF